MDTQLDTALHPMRGDSPKEMAGVIGARSPEDGLERIS